MDSLKIALVLAPHPDDGEFGCGASIHKLTQAGVEVHYAAFSPCTVSVPDGFEQDILYKELHKAAVQLGISESNIHTFDFPVRNFPEHRQSILDTLISLKKSVNPDLVFLPNSDDVHQDHQIVHQEGIRAYKHCCILGYELPWNNLQFTSNFHYRITQNNLDAKWNAISAYQSQNFRSYKSADFWKGLARVRGTQVGSEFAEAFELIRWID